MFTELVPLLKQRVVIITVSDVGQGLLRVNIIPRKLDGDSEQALALIDEKKKLNGAKAASASPQPSPTSEFKDGKPVFGSTSPVTPSDCRGLFDAPAEQSETDGASDPNQG